MPTIKELLDAEWDRKQTAEAVMAVRVALQDLKMTADQAKATIGEVVAGASFASVHADLRTEGQACIAIVDQLVAALANHSEFIDFRPDQ